MPFLKSNKKIRIMVFGTFDIFHKGHESFLKQARKLSKHPYLIVSVARDANVLRIKNHKPQNTERKRASAIKKSPLADKVILGAPKNYLEAIVKEKPEIIALGYDQKEYTKNLKTNLKKLGLNVKIRRLKPYSPHLYKSSYFKESGKSKYN